jgi:voltage-gated potassium channel
MDAHLRYRRKLYQLLEVREDRQRPAVLLNAFILLLILINVVAVVLESVHSLQQQYNYWFRLIESLSVAAFTVEYFARVWVSAENTGYANGLKGRLRYMVSPMALIDLFAILPYYLGAFFHIDTRILRILRLLRVFKLSRHSATISVLGTVLRNEAKTLAAAIFIMVILIVLASAGIYVVERNAQPGVFGSIPGAMWWATVTLTTVGYGDVVPVTFSGRLFGVVITVLGVGMAALPAGIIASGFTTELAKRRERYELAAKKLLMGGEIDSSERRQLDRKREGLGLDQDDASHLLNKATIENAAMHQAETAVCPHCGKSLVESDEPL